MKLEVGKTYRTRDGRVATVLERTGYEDEQEFIVVHSGRRMRHYPDGRYRLILESGVDLIEEIVEPAPDIGMPISPNIKPGKIYTLRGGGEAYVSMIVEGNRYPVLGIIKGKADEAEWTKGGGVRQDREDLDDIISEKIPDTPATF